MINIEDIFIELKKADIRLFVEGEDLLVDAGGRLIDDRLRLMLKTHKESLIKYVRHVREANFWHIPATGHREEGYPASSAQQRIWMLSQIEGGGIAYNMPVSYALEGNFDIEALRMSFGALIKRHEILRTVFRTDDEGKMRQFVQSPDESGFSLLYSDMRFEKNGEVIVKEQIEKDAFEPFDLAAGPLLRAAVYRIADAKWVLSCNMHHIISDGWSLDIMLDELLLFYHAHIREQANPLSPLRIQYKDYAAWQQEQLSGIVLQEHKAYWLKQFEGEVPVLELAGDKVRPAEKTFNGGVVTRWIDAKASEELRALGREQGATLFMSVLGLVNILLYRYTGQQDIVIGCPVAGRQHADLERQIGCYNNTLALRTRFRGEDNYPELLMNIKNLTLGAYEHQAYPFDELVRDLDLQRDLSRSAVFDVIVDMQNTERGHVNEQQAGEKITLSEYSGVELTGSKVDLIFKIFEKGEKLQVVLEYNSDIFTKETASRMADHLERLARAVTAEPFLPVSRLELLSPAERHQLLVEFNDTQEDYPDNKTVVELFEQQASRTPDNTAIIFEGGALTYRQLDQRSNQLGHYLRELGVREDTPVGICLDSGLEMIVGILGILKAGGAYVPIDLEYPEQRIDYILQDSAMLVLLTTLGNHEVVPTSYTGKLVALDLEWGEIGVRPDVPPATLLEHHHLAYIIYTSGSTGKPKGVLIEHASLINYLRNSRTHYSDPEGAPGGTGSFIHQSYTFDASLTAVFMPLLSGRSIVVSPANPAKVFANETFKQYTPYDFIKLTPANLTLLSEAIRHAPERVITKRLVVGGEALHAGQLSYWTQKGVDQEPEYEIEVINEYGPTEATVGCSTYRFHPAAGVTELQNGLSIGKPIDNTTLYILDRHRQLAPIGVAGELYIGGVPVGRGYLNQPELTADRFVPDPFRDHGRLYRSGDLARWLPDGTLEYLGRIDEQVKIRGHRVEPGEIETLVQQSGLVKQCVVIARKDRFGDPRLVGYVVADHHFQSEVLIYWLKQYLPDYMIPALFIRLEQMPLTSNGKIDRKALPESYTDDLIENAYEAPSNELEWKLAGIYKEVLDVDRVGVQDDFFKLGGHSLLAARLASVINKELKIMLRIGILFKFPTIKLLAQYIEADRNNQMPDPEEATSIKL
jgi:amino acid adenylation domain-containing protein